MLRIYATLLAVAASAWPSLAVAREGTRFTDRPLTLNAIIGIATPVGELGIMSEYSVSSRFAIGAGAGTNLYGIELGVEGLYRLLLSERGAAHALSIGLAFSEAPYERPLDGSGDDWDVRSKHTYWTQTDVRYEFLASYGFKLSIATGVALPVAVTDTECYRSATGSCNNGGDSIAYAPLWTLTIALGYGFAL